MEFFSLQNIWVAIKLSGSLLMLDQLAHSANGVFVIIAIPLIIPKLFFKATPPESLPDNQYQNTSTQYVHPSLLVHTPAWQPLQTRGCKFRW